MRGKGRSLSPRPEFPKKAIVTAGMPYGNKGLHFGHVGGVFIPADIYARFLRDRIGRDNVLFVSGTDCYGSPIMEGYRKLVEAGEFEGSILDYVQGNHDRQKATLDSFGISLDIYEGSALGEAGKKHDEVTDWFIRTLYENGWLEKRSTPQFYDTQAQTFLNGRQVIGRCPVQGCKSEKAYADECDLGHQFMPEDCIAPKSTLTGQTPELRPVVNWYFKLPEMRQLVSEHVDNIAQDPRTREVTVTTEREFLVPPIIYIKNELEDDYRAIADQLPEHSFLAAEKGKQSFGLEFADFSLREQALPVLSAAGIRYRSGKALVPFRLTGNIDWGVKAPDMEDVEGLTTWVWPESLWAPISFTRAALIAKGRPEEEWKEFWCSDDGEVFQFIGQDNIYFYGVAQPALWAGVNSADAQAEGTGDQLRQTTLVPNHHILFLGKKASSSGAVKPPLADELLDHYTVEQLRAHWAALGLGLKSVSFSPKVFDPSAPEKAPDPVLKEGALLTNIFNRLARSCFYTAQKHFNGKAPLGEVSAEVMAACEKAVLEYEELMSRFEFHAVMALVDEFIREANKTWTTLSRECAAKEEEQGAEAYRQLLIDAFQLLRVSTVLMHPIVPAGTELIAEHLGIKSRNPEKCPFGGFFCWNHVFETLGFWADEEEREQGLFKLVELPPRYDFFKKHESQY